MKCMKCGTAITSGQVFCENCLQGMANHPVKPGTPIQLPPKATSVAPKPSHKRVKKVRKPEEQVIHLRKTVFALILVILLLAAALCFALVSLVQLGGVSFLPFFAG